MRAPDQPLQHLLAGRLLEVEQDAALPAVEGIEVEAVSALLPGRDVAADVTAGRGVLDADHVRPQISQVQRAEGTGTELLDGDDAHAAERSRGHVRMLGSSRGWLDALTLC